MKLGLQIACMTMCLICSMVAILCFVNGIYGTGAMNLASAILNIVAFVAVSNTL